MTAVRYGRTDRSIQYKQDLSKSIRGMPITVLKIGTGFQRCFFNCPWNKFKIPQWDQAGQFQILLICVPGWRGGVWKCLFTKLCGDAQGNKGLWSCRLWLHCVYRACRRIKVCVCIMSICWLELEEQSIKTFPGTEHKAKFISNR